MILLKNKIKVNFKNSTWYITKLQLEKKLLPYVKNQKGKFKQISCPIV